MGECHPSCHQIYPASPDMGKSSSQQTYPTIPDVEECYPSGKQIYPASPDIGEYQANKIIIHFHWVKIIQPTDLSYISYLNVIKPTVCHSAKRHHITSPAMDECHPANRFIIHVHLIRVMYSNYVISHACSYILDMVNECHLSNCFIIYPCCG